LRERCGRAALQPGSPGGLEKEVFFSEEKNQKTFSYAVADLASGTNT
jgi:hypothetical protein